MPIGDVAEARAIAQALGRARQPSQAKMVMKAPLSAPRTCFTDVFPLDETAGAQTPYIHP
jgi:hypothetical protein